MASGGGGADQAAGGGPDTGEVEVPQAGQRGAVALDLLFERLAALHERLPAEHTAVVVAGVADLGERGGDVPDGDGVLQAGVALVEELHDGVPDLALGGLVGAAAAGGQGVQFLAAAQPALLFRAGAEGPPGGDVAEVAGVDDGRVGGREFGVVPAAELDVDAGVADAGEPGGAFLVEQVGGARFALGEGPAHAEEDGDVAGEDHSGPFDGAGVQLAVGVAEVAALEEVQQGGAAVGGGDHDVGAEFASVAEPDADRAVLLDEHLGDLGVVADLAAEPPVAFLDRAGQSERAALGDAGRQVGVAGQLEVERQHGEGGVALVQDVVEGLAQQRVPEAGRVVGHQGADGAPDDVEVGQEAGQHPPALHRAHQADRLEEGVTRQAGAELAQAGAELPDRAGVLGRDGQQVGFEPVGVGVEVHLAVGAPDDVEHVEVAHLLALERAELQPDLVHLVARAAAQQPADAAVEGEVAAVPAGAAAAGDLVHLQDGAAVAVHLGVAGGGESAEARPDDDHGFSAGRAAGCGHAVALQRASWGRWPSRPGCQGSWSSLSQARNSRPSSSHRYWTVSYTHL